MFDPLIDKILELNVSQITILINEEAIINSLELNTVFEEITRSIQLLLLGSMK